MSDIRGTVTVAALPVHVYKSEALGIETTLHTLNVVRPPARADPVIVKIYYTSTILFDFSVSLMENQRLCPRQNGRFL